jgi:hypothetical protein
MIDQDQFSEDPAACFESNVKDLHALDRAELEQLQMHAISVRFGSLLGKLRSLQLLADATGTRQLTSLEAVAPLLFPHSFYKSYDEQLLNQGRYQDLTDWVQKLTAIDLKKAREQEFATLDQWFDMLESKAGLIVSHSSGTTGRLSLVARSKAEIENNARYAKLSIPDWTGKAIDSKRPAQFSVIWASFAEGYSAVSRGSNAFRYGYAKTPQDFYPSIPGRLSADWHYFTLCTQRAQAAGQSQPIASPYVADQHAKMDASFKAHDAQTDAILDLMEDKLKDERVLLVGAPFVLLQLAQAGARRGLSNVLAPGSAIMSFGGLKGKPAEERMTETILRFGGVDAFTNLFVMTEAGSALIACKQGHFHLYPWVVPYLLDPVTGVLLPRDGTRTGRLALFDLLAKTYWGGLVTADKVTLDWSPCACGRGSARIHPDIGRFDDGAGEGVPPCPAGDHTVQDVMAALRARVRTY